MVPNNLTDAEAHQLAFTWAYTQQASDLPPGMRVGPKLNVPESGYQGFVVEKVDAGGIVTGAVLVSRGTEFSNPSGPGERGNDLVADIGFLLGRAEPRQARDAAAFFTEQQRLYQGQGIRLDLAGQSLGLALSVYAAGAYYRNGEPGDLIDRPSVTTKRHVDAVRRFA